MEFQSPQFRVTDVACNSKGILCAVGRTRVPDFRCLVPAEFKVRPSTMCWTKMDRVRESRCFSSYDMYVYMCGIQYIYIYIHIHTHIHEPLLVCMYACTCMHASMYVLMYCCVLVHVYL